MIKSTSKFGTTSVLSYLLYCTVVQLYNCTIVQLRNCAIEQLRNVRWIWSGFGWDWLIARKAYCK